MTRQARRQTQEQLPGTGQGERAYEEAARQERTYETRRREQVYEDAPRQPQPLRPPRRPDPAQAPQGHPGPRARRARPLVRPAPLHPRQGTRLVGARGTARSAVRLRTRPPLVEAEPDRHLPDTVGRLGPDGRPRAARLLRGRHRLRPLVRTDRRPTPASTSRSCPSARTTRGGGSATSTATRRRRSGRRATWARDGWPPCTGARSCSPPSRSSNPSPECVRPGRRRGGPGRTCGTCRWARRAYWTEPRPGPASRPAPAAPCATRSAPR